MNREGRKGIRLTPAEAQQRSPELTRRELLQNAGLLAVAVFAPVGCSDSTLPAVAVKVDGNAAGFLTADELETLRALMDTFLPPDGTPGGAEAGCAEGIDALLAAFATDPPRIYAGGPFSDRAGSAVNHFAQFVPLDAYETRAWKLRIEGSQGQAENEFNGPVQGLQTLYRDGLAALDEAASRYGMRFADLPLPLRATVVRTGGDSIQPLIDTAHPHALQFMYGAPEYGGNRNLTGWTQTLYDGDVQPRGYTAEEVSNPTPGPLSSKTLSSALDEEALLKSDWLKVAPLLMPEVMHILVARSGGSMSALTAELRAALQAQQAGEKSRG